MPKQRQSAPVPGRAEQALGPAVEPTSAFLAARTAFVGGRRVDMRALAVEVGIGRSTLYRQVGGRDALLGQVLWDGTRTALVHALHALRGSDGPAGTDRVLHAVRLFLAEVAASGPLRALLEQEPETALRLLTSRAGPVQQPLVGVLAGLLDDEDVGPPADRRLLAFAVVRLCEGFLYADVVADETPDLDLAVELVSRLLRA